MIIVAQPNQFQSVIASNNNIRSSSTAMNNDDLSYDNIYDDDTGDGSEEIPSPSTVTPMTKVKFTPNITLNRQAQAEEVDNTEYDDEAESYQNYLNDDNTDDETAKQDGSQIFGDTIPLNQPDIKLPVIDSNNNKKNLDQVSTTRMTFVPANLWRDLFSRPGILVGIIGGIVIGMLSAILLVMFIIYRMRKKDEGSYALEEGPRKSPSHAYTRVSSREFFA
ncbi:unnamed protein product [Rotaria sp. Silwood1]|nr:unnamed protein product [Rotaria sp. Silwood1]CAF1109940.1 unnamed protein product [Rotaria sp. Silwood1]CAF1450807.1 unnamed protein product [Rotaria sp. Silwood1]CAF3398611.1 unnamed protein product [Rotaria sp. Silwood1]CAF3418744.1 unnamed protein product [Rotaria sp. Silwood1]